MIPVLDFSPHSPFNILTLLQSLEGTAGEVICVFNSRDVFDRLQGHPRIDRFCYNSQNIGVGRSWNAGINLCSSDICFVFNADLMITPGAIEETERYLSLLGDAVIVGPQGSVIDFQNFRVNRIVSARNLAFPVEVDEVAGYCFCIRLPAFRHAGLSFDVRYSPCFFEEWDIAMQARVHGLKCYAVPVTGFSHLYGASAQSLDPSAAIEYFGMTKNLHQTVLDNRKLFIIKWGEKWPKI